MPETQGDLQSPDEAVSQEFDLRARVHHVLRESTSSDPRTLAAEVVAALDGPQAFAALVQALPPFIRQQISADRAHRWSTVASSAQPQESPAPTPNSWRISAVQEYAALLRERVYGADGWKELGACTAVDLNFMVRERRLRAQQLENSAQRYRRLAALLEEHHVVKVAELPGAALCGILENTAR